MLLNPHARRFEVPPEPETPRVQLERMASREESRDWRVPLAIILVGALGILLALLARGGR